MGVGGDHPGWGRDDRYRASAIDRDAPAMRATGDDIVDARLTPRARDADWIR